LRHSFLLLVLLAASLPIGVIAQHSPYAGEAARPVKALSDQEIGDYLAGKGMGYAKAAELNGYPGPAHVLELGSRMQLTAEQRAQTHAVFVSMQTDAVTVGRALIDRERALDAAFAAKSITPESLANEVQEIAALQGRLREIHLKAHLAESAILSAEQIAKYNELRGYGQQPAPAGEHKHPH